MNIEVKDFMNCQLFFFIKNNIAGATVWCGVDGFGKRSTFEFEGITINMSLIIVVIYLQSKIEPLSLEAKDGWLQWLGNRSGS